MKKNIVLIGFMGAGKTLVAKELAALLHREVVCTDAIIVHKEGKTIKEIFTQKGEPYFRQLEKSVVGYISKREDVIIDCGGGVVLDPQNVVNLKKNSSLFYLKASPGVLYERIKDQGHRPLLQVKDPESKIKELLEVRWPLYEQADHIIETGDKSVEEVCEEIVELSKGHE